MTILNCHPERSPIGVPGERSLLAGVMKGVVEGSLYLPLHLLLLSPRIFASFASPRFPLPLLFARAGTTA
jgi:hypothetical protein